MAARANDVGGIWPWADVVSVPSGTAHISAVLRRGQDILPVFDLAGRLNVQVKGGALLCLIAKRKDGPMAVCIDSGIPTLQLVSEESIRPVAWKDSDVIGTCRIDAEELPVYSLAHLGLSAMRSLDGESGGSYAKSSRS
jgi:chemotaxis signal transduction protein